MLLRNFHLRWKKPWYYIPKTMDIWWTMVKTIVLWYNIENYGSLISSVLYQMCGSYCRKLWNYDLLGKKTYSILITMELLFAMKKNMEIYHKLWYCTENYRTLIYNGEKVALYPKLWYFTQNYATILKTMKRWFNTIGKNYGTIPKLWYYN